MGEQAARNPALLQPTLALANVSATGTQGLADCAQKSVTAVETLDIQAFGQVRIAESAHAA